MSDSTPYTQTETNMDWPERKPAPDPTVPPKESPADRIKQHRFQPGNTASRGHNADKAGAVAKLIARCQRAVSPGDWAEIVQALVAKAKAGDTKAAEWLWDRLIGKPKQQNEHTLTPMFALQLQVQQRIAAMPPEPEYGNTMPDKQADAQ